MEQKYRNVKKAGIGDVVQDFYHRPICYLICQQKLRFLKYYLDIKPHN